jgi:lysophospholipase L1-like esterase
MTGAPEATPRRAEGITMRSLVTTVLIVLFSVEIGCQLAFRMLENRWIFLDVPDPIPRVFERHPYLVGTPIPRFDETVFGTRIVHNSMGTRGPEFDPVKKPGIVRIVTIGASTTYCTGVAEGQTWPEVLARELGDGYEVLNLGVPGYASVEHVIQTAFLLSDLSLDMAIYYTGWGDIRSMHVKDLKPDYSNYHPRALYQTLRLGPAPPGGTLASVHFLRTLLLQGHEDPLATFSVEGDGDRLTDRVDPRALGLYLRNMRSIIALDRSMGVIPVLIPQLLNYDALTADAPYGWIPYVKDKDLKTGMAAYNEGMRRLAEEQDVDFVGEVLRAPFDGADFWDNGHFNKGGNEKFARIVARYVLAHEHLRRGAEPTDPLMHEGLEALYREKDPLSAILHFQRLLDANPTHYGATFQLATALDQAGRPDQARPVWERFLKMAEAIGDRSNSETARKRLEQSP